MNAHSHYDDEEKRRTDDRGRAEMRAWGKSGHRRACRRLTPGAGDREDSATEMMTADGPESRKTRRRTGKGATVG